MANNASSASASASASVTRAKFEAYYLQRATRELAEDLDRLRSADDFKTAETATLATDQSSDGKHSGGAASSAANPLQILIGALRQGADMFSDADQQRVVRSGGDRATKKT